MDGECHVLYHCARVSKVMQVVVAHCVSFSRFEQTKKNLVIVAQAVVTAFVLESAVAARGHAWWCLIILAMIIVAKFERNAKKMDTRVSL